MRRVCSRESWIIILTCAFGAAVIVEALGSARVAELHGGHLHHLCNTSEL
jgi:hypothetical protein